MEEKKQLCNFNESGSDNDTMSLETIKAFFANSQLQEMLENIVQKSTDFTLVDVNTLVMYICCSLTYKNWQRPGVAINLTLSEAAKAQRVDEKFIIHSR